MEPNTHLVCAAALFCGLIATATADDAPGATPYRPTISNPAELSAPGWLELEMGWNHQNNRSDRRQALPYTAKLALDEEWGILVSGEAFILGGGLVYLRVKVKEKACGQLRESACQSGA